MKIIYLLINRFNERDYHRFGFKILETNGHKVEAWDCINLIYSNINGLNEIRNTTRIESYVKQFTNFDQLNESINRLESNTIVVLLGNINEFGFSKIIRKFNKRKIKYGIVYLANLPNIQVPYSLKIFLCIKNPKILFDKIKINIRFKDKLNLHTEINPDFILFSGKSIKKKIDKIYPKVKTKISVPSFDFDYYFKEINNIEVKESNYAVFIDEDNLNHPDLIYHNTSLNVNDKYYLDDLNNYFEKFESMTNLKVLIAGHPKGNYEKKNNNFNGRNIILNSTKELIKNSRVVLTHCSTSISYAILAKKPIIFLNSSKYRGDYQYLIEVMSRELGQKPINISKKIFNIRIPLTNRKIYKKYELNYLNNSKLNKNYSSTWELFNKYIGS